VALPTDDMEQVASAKLLKFSQGLSITQLDQVSQITIASRLWYALPAWLGFFTTAL